MSEQALGATYPFGGTNGLPTTTYYGTDGKLLTFDGHTVFTSVGAGSNWPFPLFLNEVFDVCMNVKSMWYNVSVVFEEVGGADIMGFADIAVSDTNLVTANGIINRIFVSSGSAPMFKHQSMNGAVGTRNTVNDVLIDYTRGFYDLQSTYGVIKDYWWWPYVTFQIAAGTGQLIAGAPPGDGIMEFDNFSTPIYSGVPIIGVDATTKIPISTTVFASDIYQTERYDNIYFDIYIGSPGDTVNIYCPGTDKAHDAPEYRTGFSDVQEVRFGGSSPAAFQKLLGPTKVMDRLSVIVPDDAQTGTIAFKSCYNPANPEVSQLLDVYESPSIFYITPKPVPPPPPPPIITKAWKLPVPSIYWAPYETSSGPSPYVVNIWFNFSQTPSNDYLILDSFNKDGSGANYILGPDMTIYFTQDGSDPKSSTSMFVFVYNALHSYGQGNDIEGWGNYDYNHLDTDINYYSWIQAFRFANGTPCIVSFFIRDNHGIVRDSDTFSIPAAQFASYYNPPSVSINFPNRTTPIHVVPIVTSSPG